MPFSFPFPVVRMWSWIIAQSSTKPWSTLKRFVFLENAWISFIVIPKRIRLKVVGVSLESIMRTLKRIAFSPGDGNWGSRRWADKVGEAVSTVCERNDNTRLQSDISRSFVVSKIAFAISMVQCEWKAAKMLCLRFGARRSLKLLQSGVCALYCGICCTWFGAHHAISRFLTGLKTFVRSSWQVCSRTATRIWQEGSPVLTCRHSPWLRKTLPQSFKTHGESTLWVNLRWVLQGITEAHKTFTMAKWYGHKEQHVVISVLTLQSATCFILQDVQVYRYYRDLINFRTRGNPMMMLRCINPNEAKLLDSALGIHVKFRLAGVKLPLFLPCKFLASNFWVKIQTEEWQFLTQSDCMSFSCVSPRFTFQEKFPPGIYYKIYTHRPVQDLCANSPKDYTKADTKRHLAKTVHNRENQSPDVGEYLFSHTCVHGCGRGFILRLRWRLKQTDTCLLLFLFTSCDTKRISAPSLVQLLEVLVFYFSHDRQINLVQKSGIQWLETGVWPTCFKFNEWSSHSANVKEASGVQPKFSECTFDFIVVETRIYTRI